MPVDDWAYLAGRGGEGIEALIATLLRRKYSDVQQVTPAQGDGGIDIFRRTNEGLIVYQVKKFTAAPSPSQWGQIKHSWADFWAEYVEQNEPVVAYFLVTPWTPTRPRREDFEDLTAKATFKTQWDGAAFIDGLADEFPETYARFVYGPAALDRMISAKAVLAASAPSQAEQTSYLDAVQARDNALDDLRNLVNDNYYIDFGRRTTSSPDDWPMPSATDRGVYYRIAHEEGGRFSYAAVVPRNKTATIAEPISLQIQFHFDPSSEEARQVEDWRLWGIPFEGIRGSTIQHGGPFDGERHEFASLSFVLAKDDRRHPDMLLSAVAPNGTRKGILRLQTRFVTQGLETGWLRVVAASPSGLLEVEARNALSVEDSGVEFRLASLDGALPGEVLTDLSILKGIEREDSVEIIVDRGPVLMKGTGFMPPSATEVISATFR